MLKGNVVQENRALTLAHAHTPELYAWACAERSRIHRECATAATLKEAQAKLLAHVKGVRAKAEAEAKAARARLRAKPEEVAADKAARASAKAEGAPHYTGKACPHCGSTDRLTSTGQCAPCNAGKMNEWRKMNGRN